MTPFSGDEDRIIKRMVRECREDGAIAIRLSMQGVRRTVKEVATRRRELGVKREWADSFSSKIKKDPTPEEIEERKRQIRSQWSEAEEMKHRVIKTREYVFPRAMLDA